MLRTIWYQIKNIPNHLRWILKGGGSTTIGNMTYKGRLYGTLIKADGRKIKLGLLGCRQVTTAFANFQRDAMAGGANNMADFHWHDFGTGNAAEGAANTALQTPWGGARNNGTQDNGTSVHYKSVGTVTFNNTFSITEHGIFNASANGTLLDRTVFSVISVAANDSIQATYDLTITAGG